LRTPASWNTQKVWSDASLGDHLDAFIMQAGGEVERERTAPAADSEVGPGNRLVRHDNLLQDEATRTRRAPVRIFGALPTGDSMDAALLERVMAFSPPWVRYMLTLSEISRTGDG